MKGRWYVRSEEALFRAVGDEVLLARAGCDQIDSLSGCGCLVWDLLDRPRSESAIVADLLEVYDAPAEVIEADLDRLLADLEDRGWVSCEGVHG